MKKAGKSSIFLAVALFLQCSSGHLFGPHYSLYKEKDKIWCVHFAGKKDWVLYRSENQLKPADLSSITDVVLNNNEVSLEELQHVCSLPALTFLAIGDGPEGIECSGEFRRLPQMASLRDLRVCKKDIKDEELREILRKCPGVNHLMIQPYRGGRPGETGVLTDELATGLLALSSQLETLEIIGEWSFTDKFLESISKLKKLRELRIHSKQITGAGLRIIAEESGITDLTIQCGKLRGKDIAILLATERFRKLELDFPGGKLTFFQTKKNAK